MSGVKMSFFKGGLNLSLILYLFFFLPILGLEASWFFFLKMAIRTNLISVLFVLTVLWVTMTVLTFSEVYMSHSEETLVFMLWTFLFVMSMVVLLVSDSWWVMMIGWEGLGLTSFWLVAFYSSWVAHNGSIITFMTNRVGDMCLIFSGVYWVQFYFNSVSMGGIFLLIVAILSKSSQYPLMSWLPAAMNAPTPISALVHSSTLVTAGLFLGLKFKWSFLGGFVMNISFILGSITLVVGSWAALVEKDFKKIVAFSTMSQLGLLFCLFSGGSMFLVLFHLISHAFFKSSLFMGVGTMIFLGFSDQSKLILSSFFLNSFSHLSWIYMSLLNLSSFPFLMGFYSKEASVFSVLTNHSVSSLFLIWLGLSLTLAYSYRLFQSSSKVGGGSISVKESLVLMLLGLSMMLLPLGILGVVWSSNLFIPLAGGIFFSSILMCLILGAFFYFLGSLFYKVTFFLKIWTMNLKVFSFYLDSLFHYTYLFFFVSTWMNWQIWVLMIGGLSFMVL